MEKISVIAEVSARHVHLNKHDLEALFGKGYELTPERELSQKGYFAAKETVSIIGPKRTLEKVRVLGPLRDKTQIELSKTDCYYTGIKAPLRLSGDLENSADVVLKAKNKITVNGGIVAKRHFHCSEKTAEKYNLKTGDKKEIVISGPRAGVLAEVIVRVSDLHNDRIHLDTDEANAVGLNNNGEVYLILSK